MYASIGLPWASLNPAVNHHFTVCFVSQIGNLQLQGILPGQTHPYQSHPPRRYQMPAK